MAVDIQPGSTVKVKVTKTPTNEAAAKTLSRIFARAEGGLKARKNRKELIHSAIVMARRGGRPWAVRPKAPRLFQPTKGADCTLFTTCGLIGDLNSVERFIEIEPAG